MLRCLLRGALSLLVVAIYGCWPGRLDENLKARHRAALLDGYESYRTLMWDADAEVVWFEYRLPQGLGVGDAAATIAKRITAADGCYRLLESTAEAARLRCQDARGRTGFREYLIGTVLQERCVLVMHAVIRGATEQENYPGTVVEFKKEVLNRSGR